MLYGGGVYRSEYVYFDKIAIRVFAARLHQDLRE
jgi:hypothetical protein